MSCQNEDRIFNEFSQRSVPVKSDLGKFLHNYLTEKRVSSNTITTKEQLMQAYQLVPSGRDSTFMTYIGTRNSEKVFVKSSKSVEEETKSPKYISHPVADVEAGIYECVTNQLLRYTPHLVKFVEQLYYCEKGRRQSLLVLER